MAKGRPPSESVSERHSLPIVPSAMAAKYSVVPKKGPSDDSPSARAVANLSIMGSPVAEMEEMEPIWGYARVASSACTVVHWVMMCS